MKVKELIEKLEQFDGELEVKTKARYSEDVRPLTSVGRKYETLDSSYIYVGQKDLYTIANININHNNWR